MKKFKLSALALIASVFGLTACDVPEFAKVPLDWAKANIVDPISNLIPGNKKEEHEDEKKEDPEVVSIKVSGLPADIDDETAPFQLSAEVEVKGEASKDVTWSSSNPAVATVDASGKVTLIGSEGEVTITATSSFDSSKSGSVSFEVFINPAILSVSIEGAPEEAVPLYTGAVQLSANVETKGQIAKGVNWSSSDESIATVDENGAVTFLAEGSVTITATAKKDSSKSASVTISSVNHGLRPELYEEGWTFSQEFPAAAAEFAGEEVYSFESAEGFYYKLVEGTKYNYFKLLVEYSAANIDAVLGIADTDYFYFEGSDADCFISVSQNHEIDLYVGYVSSSSSEYAIFLDIYHCEDIWETSEPTTDTEWEEETAETLADAGVELPFIALGAEYDVYVYSSGMIEISDYCCDFHKLDNYGAQLEAAGYDYLEEEGYYVKDIDAYSYAMVAFGFNEYGNSIQVMVGLTELDAFPADEVHAFVSEFSENEVPSFEDEGVKFTYEKDLLAFDEEGEDERETVFINLLGADEASISSYISALAEDGYELLGEFAYEEYSGYSLYDFMKGKILVLVEIEFESRAATEEEIEVLYTELLELDDRYDELSDAELARYSELLNGLMSYYFGGEWTIYDYSKVVGGYLYITSDSRGMEEAGVYIWDNAVSVELGETYQVEPIFYGIDPETEILFASNDSSVATVDEETGLVTAVGAGTTQIFVFTADYSSYDSIEVTVTVSKTFADALDELNALLLADGDSREVNLPAPEGFQYSSVYATASGYRILCSATESQEDYAARLAEYGYEVGEDDYGYPVAISKDFRIEPWTYGSYFIIDVYPLEPADEPEEFEDSLVFSSMGFENGQVVEEVSSEHGALVSFDKGTNSNAPKYYTSGAAIRIYGGGTFTVTAPEDGSLESIVLSFTQDKDANTVSCDVGTFDAETQTWTAPEGGCESVTFTVGGTSGHIKLASMEINGLAFPVEDPGYLTE